MLADDGYVSVVALDVNDVAVLVGSGVAADTGGLRGLVIALHMLDCEPLGEPDVGLDVDCLGCGDCSVDRHDTCKQCSECQDGGHGQDWSCFADAKHVKFSFLKLN